MVTQIATYLTVHSNICLTPVPTHPRTFQGISPPNISLHPFTLTLTTPNNPPQAQPHRNTHNHSPSKNQPLDHTPRLRAVLLTHSLAFDAEMLHSFFRRRKLGDEVAEGGVS
jgi:hypothetical protein